ncbi:MAG: radical SAM family heme chaperone HemW [Bacteroidota bacterium]
MLYLHIPYCKQACTYCNFHFSTSMATRPGVLASITKELRLRRVELPAGPVPSIYFGGGTPSLLTKKELAAIFATLREEAYWGAAAGAKSVEITLEANPDDLDERTIATLANSPVNRLSIGIQSFHETDLRFMNRAHTAAEARTAVEKVNRAGFHDVSVDLIYGGQTTTDEMWAENLRIATDLGVTHISAYALTVEPRTALGVQVAKGKVPDTDDAKFQRHFAMLVDHLTAAGYRHYEISNFCLPGHASKHNSGYWSGQPYLGIGPGAHGFDGQHRRRWNVSSNATYARALAEIDLVEEYRAARGFLYEEEELTETDRYNEFIMTGLRRDLGVSVAELTERFGAKRAAYFVASQQENIAAGYFRAGTPEAFRLSRAGLMLADGIAGDGFIA